MIFGFLYHFNAVFEGLNARKWLLVLSNFQKFSGGACPWTPLAALAPTALTFVNANFKHTHSIRSIFTDYKILK